MKRCNDSTSHSACITGAGDRLVKYVLIVLFMHTIRRRVETFIQFAGLMYGGIAEKFPKLRVSFLECGVGWVPSWMERMDEKWEKRGKVEAPLCKHKPSEYIKQGNWFFATKPERNSPLCNRAHRQR